MIYVRVIDDTGGVYVYNIPTPLIVEPDTALANSLINDLLTANTSSKLNVNLFAGNVQKTSQTVSFLVSALNSQSFSAKQSLLASSKYLK